MSGADSGIQKEIYGSATTAMIILNEQMEDVMKIVKSLEESRFLKQGITEIIKNELKEEKFVSLSMLLAILPASLLGSELKRKGVVSAVEGTISTGQGF